MPTVLQNFRLEPDLVDALRERADAESVSRTEIVKRALREHLTARGAPSEPEDRPDAADDHAKPAKEERLEVAREALTDAERVTLTQRVEKLQKGPLKLNPYAARRAALRELEVSRRG